MFQSYRYLKDLGYSSYDILKNPKCRCEYKIIDSDFEEVVVAHDIASAVIDIYEKRIFFVPINLALAFKYNHDQYGEKIENIIFYNRTYNPKYLPYADETEKQLQRLMDMKIFW